MKIAVDISQIVFDGTGVASYTTNLVRELLRQNKKTNAHQFILFGTSLRKRKILEDFAFNLRKEGLIFKTSFWLLPPAFTSTIWNQIHHVKIERLIGKVDIFHSSDWTEPPAKTKKVTTIHDLVVYKHPDSSNKEIIETQKKKLAWVKKESDAIIVDSKATLSDCEEILKIPREKMTVIYLGPGNSVIEFASEDKRTREELIQKAKEKYKLKKPYILAIGTRQPRKNLDRLVEAVDKISSVELVIAGKSGWGKDIKAQVLGYIPEKDLQALLAGASAYVHPSLYEGFGITILEALVLGVPVITSKVSSLPEVGGKAAVYVNPESVEDIKEKIISVLSLSTQAKNKLVREGYNQASKFSWEKCAKETLRVYEKVAEK